MVDVDKLKALLERATPGPWSAGDGRSINAAWETHEIVQVCSINSSRWSTDPRHDDVQLNRSRNERMYKENDANAQLIVAAVNALPDLIRERAELIEALEVAKCALANGVSDETRYSAWIASRDALARLKG